MKPWKAIAAMARNRAIGIGNQLPWHLPEEFHWFRQKTSGHILVMGRKTYLSIGSPLPRRETIVVSRTVDKLPGVRLIRSLAELENIESEKDIWICGGEQIYRQALPLCSDLFLSLIKAEPEADAFFPPFEDSFTLKEILLDTEQFSVHHYVNRHSTPLKEGNLSGGSKS